MSAGLLNWCNLFFCPGGSSSRNTLLKNSQIPVHKFLQFFLAKWLGKAVIHACQTYGFRAFAQIICRHSYNGNGLGIHPVQASDLVGSLISIHNRQMNIHEDKIIIISCLCFYFVQSILSIYCCFYRNAHLFHHIL